MKTRITVLLFALLTLLPVSYASAAEALKIGYINTQRIFRDALIAKKAAERIEAEFGPREQKLQQTAKRLQGMQEKLEKDALTMSDSDRRTTEREFNDLSRDFQRMQREYREDLNIRQNEENSIIIEKADAAIKQLADSEKYDLILRDAVSVSERVDVTDKIIKMLSDNKK